MPSDLRSILSSIRGVTSSVEVPVDSVSVGAGAQDVGYVGSDLESEDDNEYVGGVGGDEQSSGSERDDEDGDDLAAQLDNLNAEQLKRGLIELDLRTTGRKKALFIRLRQGLSKLDPAKRISLINNLRTDTANIIRPQKKRKRNGKGGRVNTYG